MTVRVTRLDLQRGFEAELLADGFHVEFTQDRPWEVKPPSENGHNWTLREFEESLGERTVIHLADGPVMPRTIREIYTLPGAKAACWEWIGEHDSAGRPRLTLHQRKRSLRRVLHAHLRHGLAWDMACVPACGTSWCINPWHAVARPEARPARRAARATTCRTRRRGS